MLLKKIFKVFIISLLFVNFTFAQTQNEESAEKNFSDKELMAFIDIDTQLREIQKTAQNNIVKAIKDQGMEVQRYQEIFRAKNKGEEIELKEGEDAAYSKIQEISKKEQGKMRTQVDAIFKKSELPRAKFNEIRKASMQDQELQQKIKELQSQNAAQ